MPNVFPFKALKYNQSQITEMKSVVTQPYDRINEAEQKQYYENNPYNFIRLILPFPSETPDPYSFSSATLNSWINQGVLEEDKDESMYIYHQKYQINDIPYTRKGLVALVEISDASLKKIYAHEETQDKPVEDRLNMLKATKTHLEPIMLAYDDKTNKLRDLHSNIINNKPLVNVEDESGNRHIVWKIADPKQLSLIQDTLFSLKSIIADGHHRFKTACRYFREEKADGKPMKSFRIMATLFNAHDKGVKILPTHRCFNINANVSRVAAELSNSFTIENYSNIQDPTTQREFLEDIRIEGISKQAFGLLDKETTLLFKSKNRDKNSIDSIFVQDTIIEPYFKINRENLRNQQFIEYFTNARDAISNVIENRSQAALILNPPTTEQVLKTAYAKQILPPKTTDFYPKLLSGLILNRFGE